MRNGQSKKVVVAMSGGVDSSVAAALLKKQGCFVVGIFMKFWKDGQVGENRCCSVESEKLARLVAKKISIPFYVVNVEKEFKKKVVDCFLKEYKKGITPNPCVVCNKEIKFGFLIKKALSLGADFVATGHYARASLGNQIFLGEGILPSASLPSRSKNLLPRLPCLLKGKDKQKDQSYFLWQLNQSQLKHVLFPVGSYTKPEVRKMAKKFKLPTAETPESQEVCFIQDTTNEFLKKYLKTKPGPVIERAQNGVNKIIGQHNGLWFYTIGQRRGLNIGQGSAFAEGFGETKPWYVVNKDSKKNILIVSKSQKDLLKKKLIAKNVNWNCLVKAQKRRRVEAKIRYKTKTVPARIFFVGKNKVKVIFDKPQRAITPGQSVVFYKGNQLLGGGTIDKVI